MFGKEQWHVSDLDDAKLDWKRGKARIVEVSSSNGPIHLAQIESMRFANLSKWQRTPVTYRRTTTVASPRRCIKYLFLLSPFRISDKIILAAFKQTSTLAV